MKIIMTLTFAMWVGIFSGKKVSAAQVPDNMVWIPAGTFMMGSPETETLRRTDETAHLVTISRGFYMSKYETTQREYMALTGRGPNIFNNNLDSPVTHVSWTLATNYCWKLTEQERVNGKLLNGYTYRLPTEAEWEYACRAGTTTPFHYGKELRSGMENFTGVMEYVLGIGNVFNPKGTSYSGAWSATTTVGNYHSNAFGLYDMHGNVREWCLDWYGNYANGPITDPTGLAIGSKRVIRGGGWSYGALSCRSASRLSEAPTYGDEATGFRPVLAWDFTGWATDVFGKLPTEKQETYSCSIERKDGEENLVVVTHGWIQKKDGQTVPPNPDWVDDTVKAIRQNLASRGLKNWRVEPYKWTNGAWLSTPFGELLDNAEKEGVNLGNCLKKQGWKHIHFISHSAGAAVTEMASLLVKENDITTTIHTTFLDAYVGFTYGGRSKYGLASDWSDSYSVQDAETVDILTGLTGGSLNFAYNVNVTSLDPNKVSRGTFRSSWDGNIEQCYQTVSSHEWAHQFYLRTIGQSWPEAKGFGFPLSKEGGNWDFALSQYKAGNNPPLPLGTPDPSCVPDTTLPSANWNPFVDLLKPLIIKSATGTSQVSANGVTLTTGSPVWLTALVPITNSVNLVSFDSQFLSKGAEGLLSVYGNTNVLGSIDERLVVQGLRHYTFSLPTVQTSGAYSLGFRLDAFLGTTSSALVTNVSFGFVGIREPFSLAFIRTDTNGARVFSLTGPSNYNYRVESSTNLVNWSTIAILVNTNGIVNFSDPSSTNTNRRFYRAATP